MTFQPTFRRTFSPTFDRRNAGGAWWNLYGVIPKANCIAAYRAKGAASLAASYVNLTGDATYNATPGATPPAWDIATGWGFQNATSPMDTSAVPSSTWSIIVRYENSTTNQNDVLWANTVPYFEVAGRWTSTSILFRYGASFTQVTVADASVGVQALCAKAMYWNGAPVGTATGTWSGTATSLKFRPTNGIHSFYVLAAAIYNVTLDATQNAALYTAIAAI